MHGTDKTHHEAEQEKALQKGQENDRLNLVTELLFSDGARRAISVR
jgi:hypothetical protein